MRGGVFVLLLVAATGVGESASAQLVPGGGAPSPPSSTAPPTAAPAPAVAAPVTQSAPPPSNWPVLPRMQLERQFAGPLQDTVIQRWRDPADGTVCYLYLPITAAHSLPTASGYVEYGANTIGTISCFPGAAEETRKHR